MACKGCGGSPKTWTMTVKVSALLKPRWSFTAQNFSHDNSDMGKGKSDSEAMCSQKKVVHHKLDAQNAATINSQSGSHI